MVRPAFLPLRIPAVLLAAAAPGLLLSASPEGLVADAPVLLLSAADGERATATASSFERAVLPVLERTCARCHEGEDSEAEVDFSLYLDEDEALAAPELWQRVAWQLWKHTMPPPSRRDQPTAEERRAVLEWVDAKVQPLLTAAPTTMPLRRLSNREYRRTVQDLTGVVFDAENFFAADPVLAGFDNQAGALSMSTSRFKKCVDAAITIARQAIVLPELANPPNTRIDGASLRDARASGGVAALVSRGTVYGDFRAPRDGRYRVVVSAFGQQAGPDTCRMTVAVRGGPREDFEVPAERGDPGDYGFEVELHEGAIAVGASFINDYYKPEAKDRSQRDRNLYIMGIRLEGPLDPLPPTAMQVALVERHGENVRAMVTELAALAWRAPAGRRDSNALLELSDKSDSNELRLRRALEAILVSPRFLFRTDAQGDDADALAARLGFLMLGGLPDEELRAAAADGRLLDDAGLRAELRRLLQSDRARTSLGEDFATQWLQLRILDGVQPDPLLFPDFDEPLRASMRSETLRLFEHLLRADRPLAELLTADYTWVDARLAEHYGWDSRDDWTRVDLSETTRRGVLGHASILTMTSTPVRTSVVIRGKWLLEVLLDAPPSPPPPGAGSLDDPGVDQSLSPRAQLEIHRQRAECAACHDILDPLGLSLENFGPLGRWRDQAGGFPVETAAVLPDGRELDGALQLSAALAVDEDALARGLLRRFATYGLGRPVGPADREWLQSALDSMPEGRPTLAALLEETAYAICQLNSAPDLDR